MQSSIDVPSSGMKGQTSVAPMRGCSPVWWFRSINSAALAIPANAALAALATGAAKVTTVRLCEGSLETSRMTVPSTAAIASRMAAMTSGRRPSEKFGTHSTRDMWTAGGRWG